MKNIFQLCFFVIFWGTLQSQTAFYTGNSGDDVAVNLQYFNGYIYQGIINGQNAHLQKMSMTGQRIWEIDLGINFLPLDVLVDGNIVLVSGRTNNFDSTSDGMLASVIDNGGTAAYLKTVQYEIPDRSSFRNIIKHPTRSNEYVVQHFSKGTGDDDVQIITINNNLDIVSVWNYDSGDDQYWEGL